MHSLSVMLDKPLEIRLGDREKPNVKNVLQSPSSIPETARI